MKMTGTKEEQKAFWAKLAKVQAELKAPKSQYNSFGKYKYRSCEDILEAVKPILRDNGMTLTIYDSVELIGERFYIKATATLTDAESTCSTECTAYAREDADKKGMDGSQITGTASSYARKYCLNGLFLIDDTKDADTDEFKRQQEKKPEQVGAIQAAAMRKRIEALSKKDTAEGKADDVAWFVKKVTNGRTNDVTKITVQELTALNGVITKKEEERKAEKPADKQEGKE